MGKFIIDQNTLAAVRDLAKRGDKSASVLMAFLNSLRAIDFTLAAEANDKIRVTGQVIDGDGNKIAKVTDVLIESTPVTGGKGTIAVVGGQPGTAVVGDGSAKLWLTSDATGKFVVDVTNDQAEVTLLAFRLDNGETELVKLTFA